MHIKDVRDLSKNYIYVIFEKTKKTQNKLYVILKSVISTIRYKSFKKNLQPYMRKWRLSVSENAKFELLFTENGCVFEKLYLTLFKAHVLVNIIM